MLPGLSIAFDNGQIGTVVPTAEGVFGLLASATPVVDKLQLNTPYTLKGMQDVANLGILPDVDNYSLYKWLKEYFEEAGEGSELWLMGMDKDTTPSEWFTPLPANGKAPAETLLDASNGRLNALFTNFSPDNAYVPVIENGMDADVALAQQKAQILCENYTSQKFTPLFTILEAYAFNGNAIDLPVINEGDDNRVGIFVGDTEKRNDAPVSLGAATGCLAGRLARIPVSENPGRVRRGSLAAITAYIVDTPVEQYDVEALHNMGYITFRTHVRKSGYYISDGPLATESTDDYSQIARRRTIDKAFRLAHNIASDEILENFDVNNDGTVSSIYAKSVEGGIENEIFNQMTANGELSRDQTNKDDLGVEARIDLTKNVVQTGRVEMTLRVRPRGENRFFNILLGYGITLNN